MTTNKEFVVSLSMLTVPSTVQAKKVILSAQVLQEQVYIQKERSLKNFKINLYRQYLFLPHFQKTLTFRIYGLEGDTSKSLLKTFVIFEAQLQKIQLQPTVFKTEQDGFELIWDSWIFTEDSEDLNSLTDRDYSQLDLPLDMIEDSENEDDEKQMAKKIRKLSSTDGSHSPSSSSEFDENDGKFPTKFEAIHHIYHARVKNLPENLGEKNKKKIKNQVYTSLVKKVSGMFGEKKDPSKLQ